MPNQRTVKVVVGCSIAGFLAMLLACLLYLHFGPQSLGRPNARWAEIVFYPGIYVGEFLFWQVSLSLKASICGGVLAMSLIDGAIGGVCGIIKHQQQT